MEIFLNLKEILNEINIIEKDDKYSEEIIDEIKDEIIPIFSNNNK